MRSPRRSRRHNLVLVVQKTAEAKLRAMVGAQWLERAVVVVLTSERSLRDIWRLVGDRDRRDRTQCWTIWRRQYVSVVGAGGGLAGGGRSGGGRSGGLAEDDLAQRRWAQRWAQRDDLAQAVGWPESWDGNG